MPEVVSNTNAGYNWGTISQVNTSVNNVIEVKIPASASEPLKELYANIAVGAMHNSADRVDAPKCHGDTRKAVQQDIFSWISHQDNEEEPRQLLWLTGPAGAGKSAIMGTMSDRLKEKGQLAGTFFFSAYSRTVERKSKRGLIPTLAYQLQQHPWLEDLISPAMMSAIRKDPAVFRMNLREQMERLILRPLQVAQGAMRSTSQPRMAIIIDGVDECGEDPYEDPDRSKQQDQIEVLSALLRAVLDPAFPFRVIVASRPETWIRRFFIEAAPANVAEIFLDDKYSPDADIRLFFKSRFAALSRRYGYSPSTWPREEDILKLIADASGQFIYAATVIRFIDSPPRPPQDQLKIVLKIKPQAKSNPFGPLDALYTAILLSSPSPDDTVLWLKALQVLQGGSFLQLSAWTVDRLFESSAGQARMLLELPSLVYLRPAIEAPETIDNISHANEAAEQNSNTGNREILYDSSIFGSFCHVGADIALQAGWNSGYSFYHKTFLDFLASVKRCGAAFPGVNRQMVDTWISDRLSAVLLSSGPEVPLEHPELLATFRLCFYTVWGDEMRRSRGRLLDREDVLSRCDPAWCVVPLDLPGSVNDFQLPFLQTIFVVAHRRCRFYGSCSAGCKRWRKAITELPSSEWKLGNWGSLAFLLDRFCVKRIKPVRVKRTLDSESSSTTIVFTHRYGRARAPVL